MIFFFFVSGFPLISEPPTVLAKLWDSGGQTRLDSPPYTPVG